MATTESGAPEATLRSRLVAGLAAVLLLAVGLGFVVDTGRSDTIVDAAATDAMHEQAMVAVEDLSPYVAAPATVDRPGGIASIGPSVLDQVADHLDVDGVALVQGDTVVSTGTTGTSEQVVELADRVATSDPVAVEVVADAGSWLGATTLADGAAGPVVVVVRDRPLGSLASELSLVRGLSLAFVAIVAIALMLVAVRLLLRPLESLVARVRDADEVRRATAPEIERVDQGDGRFAIRFRDPGGATTPYLGDEVEAIESMLDRLEGDLDGARRTIQRQQSALAEATRRVVAGQDETRRQLAGELHDGIQQQLVMLRLELTLARKRLVDEPDREDEVFADLSERVDVMLGRLRDTARGVYPAILRDRGLHEALTSLARQSHGRVRVTASPRPFPRLDLDVEANAYFLVAESVSNALKHAGAGADIDIDIACDTDRLRVRVRDDGHGFDPGDAAGGRGLANQQDRAAALGGQVEIVSGPAGTTVLALLPLEGARALPDPAVRRRRGSGTVGSVAALEVEQDGRDTAVQVDVVLDVELAEDRRDVLLDGPFHDVEFGPDSGVALAGGHEGEDLVLPRGEGLQSL